MPNLNFVALIVSEIYIYIYVYIDLASDLAHENMYFIGSETFSYTCHILSDASNIPFYSASNRYN